MYLLPEPRKLTTGDGNFMFTYYGEILLDAGCTAGDYKSAKVLQEELSDTLGFRWEIGRPSAVLKETPEVNRVYEGNIRLCNEGGNTDGRPASLCGKEEAVEDYSLTVTPDGITVTGKSSAGLWYGVQTLRQLIRTEGAVLPVSFIEDGPDIVNRGFYHDATRGRIPTMDEMKKMVDHLAFYKINQLQLYVEHSFLFRDFSEVWRDDTPLTAEDIMELDQYCKERHVELVPSLASFGHLYKVLRTKQYTELCEREDSDKEAFSFQKRMAHHTVDVTNDRSFELVKRMIEEFMPLFSSPHFNLCADETFDLGTGRSKEEGERIGKDRLYMNFLKKVCQLVIDHGRIPMFWGDIICEFPEAVRELPEGTICLNWGYAPEQTDESTKKLHDAGAIQYLCPGVQGWNNLVNDMKGGYENIRRMCSYAVQYGAAGVLNTDWGDYGHINHPEFSTVGMIYGAAFSWNKNIPERTAVNEAISHIEYGDRSGNFVDLLSELWGCAVYDWFFMNTYMEKKEGLLVSDNEWFSLDRIDWNGIPQAEEKLCALEEQLSRKLLELDERGRKCVYAYLLAAEGTHIFNRIGQVVNVRRNQEKAGISDLSIHKDYPLAADLEKWYLRYRSLWRTVSREAELYRIGEVINWYADYLRER